MTAGMLVEPDGVEVVATSADGRGLERPPLLVLDACARSSTRALTGYQHVHPGMGRKAGERFAALLDG